MASSWSLDDYRDLQRHWNEVAPPVTIASAAAVGFKPKRPAAEISDPDQIGAFFSEMGWTG